MTNIDASMLDFRQLNAAIRDCAGDAAVTGCSGQRFIGAGLERGKLILSGTPGNALGAYLNGASIEVCGNAQDAVGDTMNAGRIVVRGSIGDAAGYAMRGGELYVQWNAGYRAGIHMKAYQNKLPVLVSGGCAGSFLGEYQAGGLIVVLGLGREPGQPLVGNFCATGMHGGKILLRGDAPKDLSPQVLSAPATEADMAQIEPHLETYAAHFGISVERIKQEAFTVLAPDTKNPYKQLYTHN